MQTKIKTFLFNPFTESVAGFDKRVNDFLSSISELKGITTTQVRSESIVVTVIYNSEE